MKQKQKKTNKKQTAYDFKKWRVEQILGNRPQLKSDGWQVDYQHAIDDILDQCKTYTHVITGNNKKTLMVTFEWWCQLPGGGAEAAHTVFSKAASTVVRASKLDTV